MSELTTPNADLAYKVLDYIDAHPDQWDQGIWSYPAECGTTACFAGWAVALSGIPISRDDDTPSTYIPALVLPLELRESVADAIDGDGDVHLRVLAEALLGLGYPESSTLFDGDNTIGALREFVAEIFGPRPEGAVR